MTAHKRNDMNSVWDNLKHACVYWASLIRKYFYKAIEIYRTNSLLVVVVVVVATLLRCCGIRQNHSKKNQRIPFRAVSYFVKF